MADLLSLGLSGLRTSRNNLSVTGHNIGNIDTPGYSRQRAVQVTNNPMGTGAGYFGTGARTQTVERIVDQFTVTQVRMDTSRYMDQQTFLRQASELDGLLANETSSLGTGMNNFFDAMQSLSNDPLSQPARELVYSQTDSVSQRFKTSQARLNDQNDNINAQLRTHTAKVNELAQGIADLNKQIQVYEGSRNQPPNDLFDRRDEMLRELSEYVDVQAVEQDGNTINVMIGEGIPLIVGDSASRLEAVPGTNDKSRYEVNLVDSRGAKMNITNSITGGQMGGVIRYRRDTLDPALAEMGRIAIVFAGEMNNQHSQGIDRDGNQGGDLFHDINRSQSQKDRIPGIQREAPAGVWIDPNGLNKLPAKEFTLRQQGSNFILQDAQTGQNMTPPGGPFTTMADLNAALQDTYGFRLTDGSDGNPPGDLDMGTAGINDLLKGGLLISPTRLGASQLERSPQLTDTNKLAMSGIAGDEKNAGTARISYADLAGQKLSSFNGVDLTGAELTFDGTAFTLTDKAGVAIVGIA
ncbi:flagellar hook-associated protein FlgK, partial [Marinospirillum sp.]|uniref:flagellar hook-associated protein FlgK n=1 Tax=Marinospirillum sp. TaxID=2183934 RepID=UPI003A84A458